MAYLKTSDSIVINATLTDKGKKLLSRGKFKIAKFALGDDEIDYSLYDPDRRDESDAEEGYEPALLNADTFEAYRDTQANIQYGLDSYDASILNLTTYEKETLVVSGQPLHASLYYIPSLKLNDKLDYSPSLSGSVYYLSVNDETTEKLNSISGFKFLTTDSLENIKIIVESGIESFPGDSYPAPSRYQRKAYILDKYLLDMDYFLYTDDRLISSMHGIQKTSVFKNYPNNSLEANFVTDKQSPPVSYQSEFDNYATYIMKGIPNENYMYPGWHAWWKFWAHHLRYTSLRGPRGSIVAFNPIVNQELKGTSTSVRDFRYSDFGETDQVVFSELPTSKFDYIDTTIYIIGSTTNSRAQVPLRLIRYVGT